MAVASTVARDGRGALVALLSLAVLINYVDRGNLATAAPLIKTELHLTTTQIGVMMSAFFWAYTPGQLVAGWIADKLGGHRAMALGFALWSGATALTGLASGFTALLALRVLLGIGESTAFPCLSKLLAENVPAERLGRANGFVVSGVAFGPAFGTLAGGLILAFLGWRAMFILFGVVALLWLIPWLALGRGAQEPSAAPAPPPPFAAMLTRRALWGACLGHFSVNYSVYFVLSWLPLWLVQQRGFSILEMAKLGAGVYCVYGASSIFCGWLADRLIARGLALSAVRKTLAIACHFGVALALVGCAWGSPRVVVASLFLCGTFLGMNTVWSVVQTLAGPRAAARWVSVQNAVANTAGIVVPVVTGFMVDRTGSFDGAFLITAAVALVGAVGWAFILGPLVPVDWDRA